MSFLKYVSMITRVHALRSSWSENSSLSEKSSHLEKSSWHNRKRVSWACQMKCMHHIGSNSKAASGNMVTLLNCICHRVHG